MYSSTLYLTSVLDRWSTPVPTALPPGKTRYPLYRRLGGPQGRSGRARKISPPNGIRSPDRPASSESLYRLSYPSPRRATTGFAIKTLRIGGNINVSYTSTITTKDFRIYAGVQLTNIHTDYILMCTRWFIHSALSYDRSSAPLIATSPHSAI